MTFTEKAQKVFHKATASSQIFEAVLMIENGKGDYCESFNYGAGNKNSPMLIASITKMFTAACILKMCEQGKLSLDDTVAKYFQKDIMSGLHIFKDHEYSNDITIRNLLFHTSGLPDDFEGDGRVRKETLETMLSKDTFLTFDEVVAETKREKPMFAPGTEGKAYYANINFDLMGEILEKLTGKPLAEVYSSMIFEPLGMKHTYLPVNESDFVPYGYYGSIKYSIPKFISSCRASGGCVSTASDLMIFLKAFWNGKLFSADLQPVIKDYRKVQSAMGPIMYGGGHMRISLDGLMTFFTAKGELLGHSGSTGSYAFYYPQKDLYFVGNFTQIACRAKSIRLVLQLAMAANK